MSNYCFNYDSGEYEYIDENGFSYDQGDFVYNWDNSEYTREDENLMHSLQEIIINDILF